MRNFLLLVIIVIFISSCKKDDGTEQDMSVTMLNVSYGTNAQQKMDVYLPANRSSTNTKAIIMSTASNLILKMRMFSLGFQSYSSYDSIKMESL